MIRLMSTKPISDWTGADFTAWRGRCGLKQEAAADLLGITARRIRDFEAGRAGIPRTVELACRWLEIRRRVGALVDQARRFADDLDAGA